MKYNCLNPIAPIGLNMFPDTYDKTDNIEEADVILVRSAGCMIWSFQTILRL